MINPAPAALIGLSVLLLLLLTIWQRKFPRPVRPIAALTCLTQFIGLSVEDGTRLHVSLGHGGLLTPRGGSALAGLSMLRHLAEQTSVSDCPPVATTGDPALSLLAQDTLRAGYQAAGVEELFVPTSGRLSGMSPFGFAAGAMPVIRNENVSANIMIGHFGPESALITEAAERESVITIGASDELAAQAILFAASQDALIGEELYAAGAYLGSRASHTASLTLQDILRWLIILFLLVGSAAKFLGVI